MNISESDKSIQRSFFLSFFIWLIVVTWQVAPFNPPEWSVGVLYIFWWIIVLWGIMIASMFPVGVVVLLSGKIFGLNGVIPITFCFIWFFDLAMKESYPMIPITPGVALSAVYVFVVLTQKKRVTET